MAIRYKGNGRYAYETHNKWNKEKKKYETVWKYLGVVENQQAKEIKPKKQQEKIHEEKLILNYGDTYVLNEYSQKSGLMALVQSVFGNSANAVMALVFYKLLESSAMNQAKNWFNGNYARILFPDVDLSSQRISELLTVIGNERLIRNFFMRYSTNVYSQNGVIIDSTGLPNDISFPLTENGCHGGAIEKETRLLMVVDKDNAEPLYFRYMAGNIVDVVTLKTTIQELGVMNIAANYALIDAGYYSEDNITALYEAEIAFLTRLPSNRVLFKDVVNQTALSLENAEKFVRYGDRALYVEKVEVKIFDKYIGFAYVCCDIKRKAEEIKKILFDAEENNSPIEETKLELTKAGIFVLLSSIEIKTHDVLPLYYLRQSAEQIFHVSKSYADILPLRVHTESAFRGVLMLNFIAVVLFINFRKQIPENITAETTLKIMRNMMCKVFDNNELITT